MVPDRFMFDKFQNRVVIKAKLVAITPIFVGARADSFKPGAISGSCVKDVYGRPYIPGSSLKGALRSSLSSVLNLADDPSESTVNNSFKTKEQRDDYGTPKKLADAVIAVSTHIESLFGSQVMAGKVKIADAIPVENQITTEVRNGVAIDRDTRTAFGGALFDTEVVPSGTVFNFIASAENLSPDEAELFGKLIEYFSEGNITIGGRSRAGLGNVQLRDVNVTLFSRSSSERFPAESAIEKGLSGIKEAVLSCLQN